MNKIIRKKNENYTTISNVCVRDNRLSLKAKGLMSLVMSLPDGWDFSIHGLSSIVKEGKAAIYAAINELKEFGYCKVVSNRNEKGIIIGNDYTFFEEPHTEKPHTEKPHTEKPHTENQDMDNPCMDNRPQINKEIKEEKIETIEEKKDTIVSKKEKATKEFVPPTLQEVQAYIKEKCYNFSAKAFIEYYEADDWHYGKGNQRKKVSNWKRCCATWGNIHSGDDVSNYDYPTSIDDVKDDDIVANIEHLKYVMFEKKFPKIYNNLNGLPNTQNEFDRMVKVTVGGLKGVTYVMLVLERDGWEKYDDPNGFMWIYANFIKSNGLYKERY